jgi:endo-1,4-beta-mannosidase
MMQPFTLGVNYWPRRKAMTWWSNFDRGEVREEFAIIREYGMTLVRIFLLWDDWQPEPGRVSFACLDHLAAVCDAAADNGLQLDITFFTGHMSGPNWAPRWLLGSALSQVPSPQVRQVVSGGKA